MLRTTSGRNWQFLAQLKLFSITDSEYSEFNNMVDISFAGSFCFSGKNSISMRGLMHAASDIRGGQTPFSKRLYFDTIFWADGTWKMDQNPDISQNWYGISQSAHSRLVGNSVAVVATCSDSTECAYHGTKKNLFKVKLVEIRSYSGGTINSGDVTTTESEIPDCLAEINIPSTCLACRAGYKLVSDTLGGQFPDRKVCQLWQDGITGCIQSNEDMTVCYTCGTALTSLFATD